MNLLDGKKIAEVILVDLKNKIIAKKIRPELGVVLVGSDEASQIYVNLKGKAAERVGIGFRKIAMSEKSSEADVLKEIEKLNLDSEINGIIVQLPLPSHLDKIKIIQAIDPKKDVDGFHSENINLFFAGRERFAPVFPSALMQLLKSTKEKLENKKALVICNSQEFGKAMQMSLERENILAQYCFLDDVQNNLVDLRDADVIITACGAPNLIQEEMLKDGVIIIDGGITRVENRVVGDVYFESVKNLNGYLSPVPGGVGPVTIACLLANVCAAVEK